MPVQSRFPVDRFAGPRPAYLQSALFLLRDTEAVTQIDPHKLALPYFNVFFTLVPQASKNQHWGPLGPNLVPK